MLSLIGGFVIFVVTAIVFWYCLPRDGKMHRFVGTEFEPYVGVAFCSAIALSFTMILSGAINIANGGSKEDAVVPVKLLMHDDTALLDEYLAQLSPG